MCGCTFAVTGCSFPPTTPFSSPPCQACAACALPPSQHLTTPLSESVVPFGLKARYLVFGLGHTPPLMPSHCTLTWRSRQRKVSGFQTALVLQRFLNDSRATENLVRLQGAAVPLRRLSKPRNPGVAARSVGLSAVAPTPISPLPQTLQRPELARHHESGKRFLFGLASGYVLPSAHLGESKACHGRGVATLQQASPSKRCKLCEGMTDRGWGGLIQQWDAPKVESLQLERTTA